VRAGLLPKDGGREFIERRLGVFKAHLQAARQYRPQPYDGRVIHLQAAERPGESPAEDSASGWSPYTVEPVPVHLVPGDHQTMLGEANSAGLAEILLAILA
jgi:thioesterase domain-containing protein